jgi:hypothetical protein
MHVVEGCGVEKLGLGQAIDEIAIPASHARSAAITTAATGSPAAFAACGLGFSLGQDGDGNVAHGRSIVSISTSSLAGSLAKRHCRLRRKTGSSGTVERPAVFTQRAFIDIRF